MKYISQNKKEQTNTCNKEVINDIMVGIMPFIMITLVEIFFKVSNGGIPIVLNTNANSFVFSVILAYLIYAIGISLTKKNTKALQILCVISFVVLLINQMKILYTGEPIYFSDANFLEKTGDFVTMLSSHMISMILPYVLAFLLLGIIFVMIIKWCKQYEFEIVSTKLRIVILIVSTLIVFLLFIPNNQTKELYLKLFFNIEEYKDYDSYTTNLSYYQQHTLLSGMYGVLLNNRFVEPKNYNEQEIKEMIKSADVRNKSELGNPNIILLFSEAFWDIDKLQEITFDKPITANLNQFKQEGKCIELLSCAYGGMSENVAFELLTGGSLNYFTRGYIPTMSLYKKKNSKKIPSIVKELKNNNYHSKIVFGKDFYNSKDTFLNMGFDEYVQLKQTAENTKGKFISDEYMTDLIIEELQNKEKDKPIFYMAETIQNHMPYTKDKYEKYDIEILQSNLDKDKNNTLLSYSQGVYDADKQLQRLYEYIKEYEEPTMLIFLGDHLPYLYTEDRKNVIEYLTYFNTSEELENIYRRYNTQAFILSNYDIKQETFPEYLSNDLLLTYFINHMNLEVSSYYKWLYTTIQDLPASNRYIALDKEGNKYKINNLKSEMKKIYSFKEMMQYKFFIKVD